MPELPEVETVRRGLESALTGASIHKVLMRRRDLRMPFPKDFAEMLRGRHIKAVERRAKYLLFRLDSGDVIIAHLGMTGRFSVGRPPKKYTAHDHVIFHLRDGRCAIYNDTRRFGLMALAKSEDLGAHPLLRHLGPEPLNKAFSPSYLEGALAGRKGSIKPVLMDQKLVVGVGNIYASEALFLAGIDPRKPAYKVQKKSPEIIRSIRTVLRAAIASGGSSLRDFLHVSGEAGYFQHRFKVYDRNGEPCVECGAPIQSIRQAGRTTFFCQRCQQ